MFCIVSKITKKGKILKIGHSGSIDAASAVATKKVRVKNIYTQKRSIESKFVELYHILACKDPLRNPNVPGLLWTFPVEFRVISWLNAPNLKMSVERCQDGPRPSEMMLTESGKPPEWFWSNWSGPRSIYRGIPSGSQVMLHTLVYRGVRWLSDLLIALVYHLVGTLQIERIDAADCTW